MQHCSFSRIKQTGNYNIHYDESVGREGRMRELSSKAIGLLTSNLICHLDFEKFCRVFFLSSSNNFGFVFLYNTMDPQTNGTGPTEGHIWVDGCYDMVHFGHANSFRQSKALGTHLTVGVHSDAEIARHKGAPPVFNENERYEMVRAIKWVDQVVEAAPYVTTLETLNKYGCDYCAHGNDITLSADGTDTYHLVKAAGRYKDVDRTQGVSTTDLLKRILNAARRRMENLDSNNNKIDSSSYDSQEQQQRVLSPYTGTSKLLLTSHKISCFSDNRPPKADDKLVYVAGSFDVFHPGHLSFLKKARELGSYLLVGVYDDVTVELIHGSGYPIMSLSERALSLLACRYVSDVVIGAPLQVSKELLQHFNVSVVAIGKDGSYCHPVTNEDLYAEAKSLCQYTEIDSGSKLTTEEMADRVAANFEIYEQRNKKKEQAEAQYIANNNE